MGDTEEDGTTFENLLVPDALCASLRSLGMTRPSPVQRAALPAARAGKDLVVQARAGTGKTLVYAIRVLEAVETEDPLPQALVLSPTRETALQAAGVLNELSPPSGGPAVRAFIGGLAVAEDERVLRRPCQIAVGTPGRLRALLEGRALRLERLRVVVLDEADRLLVGAFRADVLPILGAAGLDRAAGERRDWGGADAGSSTGQDDTWGRGAGVGAASRGGAAASLPPPPLGERAAVAPRRPPPQLIAASATFDPEAIATLARLAPDAASVRLSVSDGAPVRVQQFYSVVSTPALEATAPAAPAAAAGVPATPRPDCGGGARSPLVRSMEPPASGPPSDLLGAALALLSQVRFGTAAIFCGTREASEEAFAALHRAGHPAALLSASRDQLERLRALNALRDLSARVLVATDVAARGVDLPDLDLVISLSAPPDAVTYRHRAGRAGRFGRPGASVVLVASDREASSVRRMSDGRAASLPEPPPADLCGRVDDRDAGDCEFAGRAGGGATTTAAKAGGRGQAPGALPDPASAWATAAPDSPARTVTSPHSPPLPLAAPLPPLAPAEEAAWREAASASLWDDPAPVAGIGKKPPALRIDAGFREDDIDSASRPRSRAPGRGRDGGDGRHGRDRSPPPPARAPLVYPGRATSPLPARAAAVDPPPPMADFAVRGTSRRADRDDPPSPPARPGHAHPLPYSRSVDPRAFHPPRPRSPAPLSRPRSRAGSAPLRGGGLARSTDSLSAAADEDGSSEGSSLGSSPITDSSDASGSSSDESSQAGGSDSSRGPGGRRPTYGGAAGGGHRGGIPRPCAPPLPGARRPPSSPGSPGRPPAPGAPGAAAPSAVQASTLPDPFAIEGVAFPELRALEASLAGSVGLTNPPTGRWRPPGAKSPSLPVPSGRGPGPRDRPDGEAAGETLGSGQLSSSLPAMSLLDVRVSQSLSFRDAWLKKGVEERCLADSGRGGPGEAGAPRRSRSPRPPPARRPARGIWDDSEEDDEAPGGRGLGGSSGLPTRPSSAPPGDGATLARQPRAGLPARALTPSSASSTSVAGLPLPSPEARLVSPADLDAPPARHADLDAPPARPAGLCPPPLRPADLGASPASPPDSAAPTPSPADRDAPAPAAVPPCPPLPHFEAVVRSAAACARGAGATGVMALREAFRFLRRENDGRAGGGEAWSAGGAAARPPRAASAPDEGAPVPAPPPASAGAPRARRPPLGTHQSLAEERRLERDEARGRSVGGGIHSPGWELRWTPGVEPTDLVPDLDEPTDAAAVADEGSAGGEAADVASWVAYYESFFAAHGRWPAEGDLVAVPTPTVPATTEPLACSAPAPVQAPAPAATPSPAPQDEGLGSSPPPAPPAPPPPPPTTAIEAPAATPTLSPRLEFLISRYAASLEAYEHALSRHNRAMDDWERRRAG